MDNYFSVLLVVLIGFSACQSEPDKKVSQTTKSISSAVEQQTDENADNQTVNKKIVEATKKELGKPSPQKTIESPEQLVNNKVVDKKTKVKAEKASSPQKAKPKKKPAKDEKLSAKLVSNSKTASKNKKEKSEPLPELVFDYKSYDFGIVNHGDTVTHKFYFVNEGDAPAIISEASSSCGCTIPEYPRKPIKPGQRAFIKAVFATKGKLNTQKKSITIKANTEPNYTTLYLEGEVYNRPKKKEPVDSTKLDSIKKATKKAVKDSLKIKKKADKKQTDKKQNTQNTQKVKEKEDLAKDSKQEKKTSTNANKDSKEKEEIDYFLPPPKPKKKSENSPNGN